jgi:hypothetical protein
MQLLGGKRISPALVVAMAALFVALGGTAGAVVTATVPLAKRALMADNARKLGGQTPAQLTAQAAQRAMAQASEAPGPASTAAGIVTVKTQAVGTLPDDQTVHPFRITCDAGQKVLSGGLYSSNNVISAYDSYPADASTWELSISHNGSDPTPANVSVYAVCIK